MTVEQFVGEFVKELLNAIEEKRLQNRSRDCAVKLSMLYEIVFLAAERASGKAPELGQMAGFPRKMHRTTITPDGRQNHPSKVLTLFVEAGNEKQYKELLQQGWLG